jgi:hypothetical protein
MPAKEIKELRQAGNLEAALMLAKSELQSEPENVWAKRNICWVYYDYIKQHSTYEKFDLFVSWLEEIKDLELPEGEKLFFDQLSWQVGKMVFSICKNAPHDIGKIIIVFRVVQSFKFSKFSAGYSFLYKAFHKGLKDTDVFLEFADWWDFKNFLPEDFQKEKLPNGKEIMSIAEQAYISYAKNLLPKHTSNGELTFDKQKAEDFLPILSKIVEDYPHFQYPAYFNAKLLLALGNKDNMLESLLPFAKKKRNDFWVWEILAEAFSEDNDKVFACYCKALTCKSPEEMLVGLRQKMARILISRKMYNEAKTEIDILVQARINHDFKIPSEVSNWQATVWYKSATRFKSNLELYNNNLFKADSLLFSDTKEELIIVEFVNSDKKIINFINSEMKLGFLKYDRFFSKLEIGDVLNVRFQGAIKEGLNMLQTATKVTNDEFKKQFFKKMEGVAVVPTDKKFGFLEDVYIHPSIIAKYNITHGLNISGEVIKTYNQEKMKWGWKLISVNII